MNPIFYIIIGFAICLASFGLFLLANFLLKMQIEREVSKQLNAIDARRPKFFAPIKSDPLS